PKGFTPSCRAGRPRSTTSRRGCRPRSSARRTSTRATSSSSSRRRSTTSGTPRGSSSRPAPNDRGAVSQATVKAERGGPFRRRKEGITQEGQGRSGPWYPRWFWPAWAAPGILWLLVLFILPFYVVICVAFGTTDLFQNPVPVWQPWYWTVSNVTGVYHKIFGSNAFLQPVFVRTLVFVLLASLICVAIGYTVAYYVARY